MIQPDESTLSDKTFEKGLKTDLDDAARLAHRSTPGRAVDYPRQFAAFLTCAFSAIREERRRRKGLE